MPVISVDQRDGARRATEHLLALGHRTVWHIAGPEDWLEARDRELGWRETLERHGVGAPRVIRGDWSSRSGYEAGRSLAKEKDLDAVFAGNDQMALGLLRAFAEAGVSVPRDVRVAGFDDVPEAAYYIPPLTTVRPDFDAVAAASIDLRLAQITTGHRLGDRRVLTPTLITRESVAAPRS